MRPRDREGRGLQAIALGLVLALIGCGETIAPIADDPGTKVYFDLSGRWSGGGFFDFPYPSNLRLKPGGGPDLSGFPVPKGRALVRGLRDLAEDRLGFPVIPVAFFRFDQPLSARTSTDVIPAEKTSPLLLVDVDPRSARRGALTPVVATLLAPDRYAPKHLLAVAPRPGMVLEANHQYAFLVMRSLKDAQGAPLGVPRALKELQAGRTPAGTLGASALQLYRPLWSTLAAAGIDQADVAAATVFSTGDSVAATAALTDRVLAKHSVTIDDLKLDSDDGDHPRYCELLGTVTYPRFQRGKAPYDSEGRFDVGADGLPKKQGEEKVKVVITLPKAPMPDAGYPLMVYIHGSGGVVGQIVDRGTVETKGGAPIRGEGPAHVIARFGVAGAASAMPINPERVPGAGDYDYINFANLPAFRDTFRQGVIEARLFIAALAQLKIPPSALGACAGPKLPAGKTSFFFRAAAPIALMGQSMGGMYTNMVAAVEPRVGAVIPTGAGGFWSYFLFVSDKVPASMLGPLLGTLAPLSFLHPAVHLIQTAWESADPIIYAARIARWPLRTHPVRHIYQPVGKGDSYFPMPIYDAMTLAYGHKQAGKAIWSEMQQALALRGLAGLIGYPVRLNLRSEDAQARKYTGVVVQYEGDGIYDPHAIAFQLDDVKYQYGCFLSSFFDDGVGVVLAPRPLGTPCK